MTPTLILSCSTFFFLFFSLGMMNEGSLSLKTFNFPLQQPEGCVCDSASSHRNLQFCWFKHSIAWWDIIVSMGPPSLLLLLSTSLFPSSSLFHLLTLCLFTPPVLRCSSVITSSLWPFTWPCVFLLVFFFCSVGVSWAPLLKSWLPVI